MIRSIPKSILAIGIAYLLINAATSVVFSISALYLKTVLSVSLTSIGLFESTLEGIAYLTRTFSGVLSDYLKKRKIFLILGFSLLTISKPLLAFSNTYIQMFLARMIDRLGNGLQASPRDALIGDLAPKQIKGTCYGLRQSLALLGSTIGGIFGILIMQSSNNNYQLLFLIASIPAVFALLVIIFFVQEKINYTKENVIRKPIKIEDIKQLGVKFWALMIIVIVMTLGRFSEVFICLLACEQFNLSISYGPIFPVIYCLASATVAFPIGKLSDSINHIKILLFGLIFFTLSHLLIGLAANLSFIIIGTILWGIYEGITDSIIANLITDFVPKELRGTGFGLYSLIASIAMAIASIFAGKISEMFSQQAAFIYGSVTGTLAIITLINMRRYFK